MGILSTRLLSNMSGSRNLSGLEAASQCLLIATCGQLGWCPITFMASGGCSGSESPALTRKGGEQGQDGSTSWMDPRVMSRTASFPTSS